MTVIIGTFRFLCKSVLNDIWNLFFNKVYLENEWKKGNCTHLAKKNSQVGAKIATIFTLSWTFLNCIIIKNILKANGLLWASKSCYII